MSGGSPAHHRWLDAFARWSVRGGDSGVTGSSEPGAALAVIPGGTTRRAALGKAAGAAGALAVLGSLGPLKPGGARAAEATNGNCARESFESVLEDFRECVRQPKHDFQQAGEDLAAYEKDLRETRNPKGRRFYKRAIKFVKKEQAQALKELQACDARLLEERANGAAKCKEESPSPGGGAGAGGGGGSEGCGVGYAFCADHCCNLSNAYCQGCNGKIICCRLESDCCPSG